MRRGLRGPRRALGAPSTTRIVRLGRAAWQSEQHADRNHQQNRLAELSENSRRSRLWDVDDRLAPAIDAAHVDQCTGTNALKMKRCSMSWPLLRAFDPPSSSHLIERYGSVTTLMHVGRPFHSPEIQRSRMPLRGHFGRLFSDGCGRHSSGNEVEVGAGRDGDKALRSRYLALSFDVVKDYPDDVPRSSAEERYMGGSRSKVG